MIVSHVWFEGVCVQTKSMPAWDSDGENGWYSELARTVKLHAGPAVKVSRGMFVKQG